MPILRADFYGPDGLPVVSLRCDSSGALVYLPDEGEALYSPQGLPVGPAALQCRDLIVLVRAGFPADLPQWAISLGGDPCASGVVWSFTAGGHESDTMLVTLRHGDDFPRLTHAGGSAEVTSTSPGDIYDAWPTSWHLSSGDDEFDIRIRSVSLPEPPPPSAWTLEVRVPVDTTDSARRWVPAWEIPVR